MSKSIFIENGRIVDPSQNLDAVANLLVINGKVAGINVDPAGVDPKCRVTTPKDSSFYLDLSICTYICANRDTKTQKPSLPVR